MNCSVSITEVREKCKNLFAKVPRDLLVVGILLIASFFSFGFGYLAGVDARPSPPTEEQVQASRGPLQSAEAGEDNSGVVASKNGTRYYFSWCAGANRISDDNKVWFASASAAIGAGYTLARNCKDR